MYTSVHLLAAVAYGEEGDYYLIFTVSGNSQSALQDATPAFKQLVARCKQAL